MISYKERLSNISTFIFDVDGVLTNGKVILFKDEMVRMLNTKDGYALQYASKMGFRILVITGGNSEEVQKQLLSLGCTEVVLRSSNKMQTYNSLKEKYNFTDNEVMFMGDDIPDYQVMSVVGLSACPQDASVEIKEISHYQSPFSGGKNCVRDIIEQTLRVQNKWFKKEAFHW